jgi:sporulation protein YlmC with PRC-barrel domain
MSAKRIVRVLGAASILALGAASMVSAQTTAPAQPNRSAPAAKNNTEGAAMLGGQSVRKLVGKTVYNLEGKSVGTIGDFVVDTRAPGEKPITYAVVGVGGFLGLGKKDVAIPIDHMRLQGDRIQVSSNVTEDQLKRMAEYDASRYRSVARDDTPRSDRRSDTSRPSSTR